ncbi:MAG: pyruvate synthase subunit PorB [Candidatus Thermoplasmatota archaeon]
MKIKDLPDEELFTSGHTACPGCGGAIAIRIAMKVYGKNSMVYNPACCLLVFSGTYPLLAWKVPYHHVLFENTAACATGMKRALNRLGKPDVFVLGIAGDGGTADIGMQALSGAAERNEDIIYIMYDNEAYMNTGIQRSGATPYGAITTTTPRGTEIAGKKEFKKDVPQIMIAHEIPYVATACVSYPADLLAKLEKSKNIKGCRFLQILSPCPTGWRFDPSKTIEIGKKAVESGMWTLYEYENGKIKINRKPKFIPVKEYLSAQGRFSHLTEEDIEKTQQWVKNKWEELERKAIE